MVPSVPARGPGREKQAPGTFPRQWAARQVQCQACATFLVLPAGRRERLWF